MKKLRPLLLLATAALLASCGNASPSSYSVSSGTSSSTSSSSAQTSSSSTESSSSSSDSPSSVSESSVLSSDSDESSSLIIESSSEPVSTYVNEDFSMITEDGAFSVEEGSIVISTAGTYVLSGTYQGIIYINAGDDDTVELDLNGVELANGTNAAIYCLNANKLKIKAMENTENSVIDLRAVQETEDETQGGGAIYSKVDTSFVGKGVLNVAGSYNNGVHVTKDLSAKNLTLNVVAPNNALKGNDSVSIESGTYSLVSIYGDGIKTSDSDISSKGKQRGTVTISGGTFVIDTCYDGIDASYDIVISGEPSITIATNEYRSSSSVSAKSPNLGPGGGGPGGGGPGGGGNWSDNNEKSEASAKGLKAANEINISGGTFDIAAYDDGIHANYGDTLESGAKGLGNVNISGGSLTLSVADDGIHADSELNISGGTISVAKAHEGLEGNVINVSGGTSYVYGEDDGVNATSGPKSPLVNVTDGYLFVCVPSNGDVDGIDSNGTYYQSGGTVITCGPNSWMASALDSEQTGTVVGGTLIVFGTTEHTPNLGNGVTKSSKSGTYSGGKAYTITFADNERVTSGTLLSGSSYSSCQGFSVHGSISSIG